MVSTAVGELNRPEKEAMDKHSSGSGFCRCLSRRFGVMVALMFPFTPQFFHRVLTELVKEIGEIFSDRTRLRLCLPQGFQDLLSQRGQLRQDLLRRAHMHPFDRSGNR